MGVADQIRDRLVAELAPESLEVIDESESHRGHAGFKEGGESHFRVRISAPTLEPMSRIARHRAIHAALGKDLMQSIHALAIEIDA